MSGAMVTEVTVCLTGKEAIEGVSQLLCRQLGSVSAVVRFIMPVSLFPNSALYHCIRGRTSTSCTLPWPRVVPRVLLHAQQKRGAMTQEARESRARRNAANLAVNFVYYLNP